VYTLLAKPSMVISDSGIRIRLIVHVFFVSILSYNIASLLEAHNTAL
jgi:hypothetical protein